MPRSDSFRGRVLIIAGSDSGGGAGVQADIKTVTALGGYAATAITAVTVQNTLGVTGVHPIPVDIVEAQARAVLDDIGADAIKTGMLGDVATVEAVARLLDGAVGIPAVIDPVMIAKGGASLLQARAVEAVKTLMVPRAALLTPNAPEAEALTGLAVRNLDGQRRAGEALLALGAKAVLMKGGHVSGERIADLLLTPRGETLFEGERIDTRHTHGTGCTLASACAVGLAQGLDLTAAVARAWNYIHEAMLRAPGFGAGHGPLDHAWPLRGNMTRLMLLTAVLALGGCGFVDIGVERGEARFKNGENLMCAYAPPQSSSPWAQGFAPNSRESNDLLRRVCPDLKREDIPMALLRPEETVIFALKDCRVTRIIKEQGVLVDLAPDTCRSSGDAPSSETHAH